MFLVLLKLFGLLPENFGEKRKPLVVAKHPWGSTNSKTPPHWFQQYGPWDLRVDCPCCGQWEAFFLGVVPPDGIISLSEEDYPCKTCGFIGDIQLEGWSAERTQAQKDSLLLFEKVKS
jgi:hypothetical protein